MSAPNPSPKDHTKRNRILVALGAFLLLVALGWVLWYIFWGRFYVSTEDAYVAGNQVMLAPQVAGGIVAIYGDNTDLVEQGQVVILLDNTDHLLTVEEKKESLADIVRQVSALFEVVGEKEAAVEMRRAELIQAKLNLSHRTRLVETGAVAKEDFEQHETDVNVKEAAYLLALRELDSAKALVAGTTVPSHPRVRDAAAALKEAYLNLIRCEIIAPATGYIARRKAQVGDWVLPGQTLLMVVPLDYLWVDANFKETQLSEVRIGQSVTFTADIYGGGVEYHGEVVGFTAGTGSAFALLPAQNASGNWIKIIQRLPVRVSIDPKELKEHPLFIGLSTNTTIDIHDTSGKKLCPYPVQEPSYMTYIYEEQNRRLSLYEPVIEKIIATNDFQWQKAYGNETCSD